VISFRFAKMEPPELRATDHYRGRAADCLILSECTDDTEARMFILAFAETFEQIARDAEAFSGDALLK
jgi:hypothetical protein